MTADLRIGLAGYGLAGEAFHAPLIAATEGLALRAVRTRDPERAARAAARHPGVRVVQDAATLLDGIDVLVVASPNRTHAELAHAGLAAGLHVVVDKPLAPTAAEARALAAAADGRLTVFQNRRLDGDFLTAQRLVADGTLGPITRLESRFERFRPEVRAGVWRESADPADGGGLLLDLGTHLLDQAIVLLGPVTEIRGELDVRRPGARVPDDVVLAVRHASGARSHLHCSAITPLVGPRLRLSGLAGGFATDGMDPQEAQLRAGMTPDDEGFGVAGPGRLVTLTGEREQPLEAGAYVRFYAAVRDWVRGEAPAPVDPADAVTVLELLERAAGVEHRP